MGTSPQGVVLTGLMLGTFVAGSAEVLTVGLLPLISRGLQVASAVVPHYGWFVATRLLTGALQGLFLAAAFTTATAVVPRERAGRAISVVIAGFSISTVVGLPT